MRSENRSTGQGPGEGKRRSFIEEARRAQIIDAAVETIAEFGYVDASLARIAQRADISKGVISYHFDGKDELLEQVVVQVYGAIAEEVGPKVRARGNGREALRTHILEVARHMQSHRVRLLALTAIFAGARTRDGSPRYGQADNEPIYQGLESMFRRGQEEGEFRDFDVRVMAVTLQGALDSMFSYWVARPEYDMEDHARELAEMFDRATRASSR